jgi:hypothetical protein
LEKRYRERIPDLELYCDDVLRLSFPPESFDCIFGMLFFEDVAIEPVLEKLALWLKPGGSLVIVLQLPSGTSDKVTRIPYRSLKFLDDMMNLIDPSEFSRVFDL